LFARVASHQSRLCGPEEPWLYLDQTHLNIELQMALSNGELTFAELPKSWNYLSACDPEQVVDPYMLHLASVTSRQKMGMIRSVVEAFDWLDTVIRGQAILARRDG
jgi:hypothetical protein